MKRFVVEWLPAAEEQLAAIWSAASYPNDITRASYLIDKVLEQTPVQSTTTVDEYQFLRSGPLVVLCRVDDRNRIVTVIDAKAAETSTDESHD